MISHEKLTATSPAAESKVEYATYWKNLDQYRRLKAVAKLTGATGGTLNVTLQTSWDNGTTWFDWWRSSDVTAGAAAAYFVATSHEGDGTQKAVGTALVPALAKGAVAPGPHGSWMRIVFEAGASTSAGALQEVTLVGIN